MSKKKTSQKRGKVMQIKAEKKVAVILCGSGFKDGSEIHESVATLWALSQHPVSVQCFAPDADQADVVNCLTTQVMPGEKRNMLIEAARIARGAVLPLSSLNPDELSAIILPGGFGAAKNLCSFAFDGARASVRPELKNVLEKMHHARKPIGAICIAPVVVALSLPGQKIELTFGKKSEASDEIEKLGHRHVECRLDDCHVDRMHRVVTSPAYMYSDATLGGLFTGIQKLVAEVVLMA